MPTIEGLEDFTNGMSGGGAPFAAIAGSPTSDTGTTHAADPASLLIDGSVAEWVRHNVSSPTRAWTGFWFRLNSADEPASDKEVAIFEPAAGVAGFLAYAPASNALYWYMSGSGFPSAVITLDAWHWVEAIFDVSGGTRTLDVRIDGSTGTQATVAAAASSVSSIVLGDTSAAAKVFRYSYWNRGSASSTSDWSGELTASSGTTSFFTVLGVG